MRTTFLILANSALLLSISGCSLLHYEQHSGKYISARISQGRPVSPTRTIKHEIVAVAEIGESKPSDSLIWEARWLEPYFDRAILIAGGDEAKPAAYVSPTTRFSSSAEWKKWDDERARDAVALEAQQLRAAEDSAIASARANGAHYLMLVQSSSTARSKGTPLRVLWFLIVPFWIVPTESVHAQATGTLVLIDTADSGVVFTTSADDEQTSLARVIDFYSPVPEHATRTVHRRLFDQLKNRLSRR